MGVKSFKNPLICIEYFVTSHQKLIFTSPGDLSLLFNYVTVCISQKWSLSNAALNIKKIFIVFY